MIKKIIPGIMSAAMLATMSVTPIFAEKVNRAVLSSNKFSFGVAEQSMEIEINETNFPDANFRKDVKQFDTNEDGRFSESELRAVTEIDQNCFAIADYKRVKNLKGIEYFTELTKLDCSWNDLKSLDVSNNTALNFLACGNNKLKSLDVSNNTALTVLMCDTNNLKSLDVSNNKELTTLYCYCNQINSLDLSNNSQLELNADFDQKSMECIIPETGIDNKFYDLEWDEVITDTTDLTGGKIDQSGKIVFNEGSDTISFNYNGYHHKLIKEGTKQSATITFKIVNGSWLANGIETNNEIVIELIDGKGTLESHAVPTDMIADIGYGNGHWDVEPVTTANGITGDVTYTYIFTENIDTEIKTEVSDNDFAKGSGNIEVKNIDKVPSDLKKEFTSVKDMLDKTMNAVKKHIKDVFEKAKDDIKDSIPDKIKFEEKNTMFFDAKMKSGSDGKTILPMPVGVDPKANKFLIAHIMHNGDIEVVEGKVTENGIEVKLNGLSPVMITWFASDLAAGEGMVEVEETI